MTMPYGASHPTNRGTTVLYTSVCYFFRIFHSSQRFGTTGRLCVVLVSNVLAIPFAVGQLLASYPWCFVYMFAGDFVGAM